MARPLARVKPITQEPWCPQVLPLLHEGVKDNGPRVKSLCSTSALEWGNTRAAADLGTFDLLLASDCLYEPELAAPLVTTLEVLLKRPSAVRFACDAAAAASLPDAHPGQHPHVLLSYDEGIGRGAAVAAFRERAETCFVWEELQIVKGEDHAPGTRCAVHSKNTVKLVRLSWRTPHGN